MLHSNYIELNQLEYRILKKRHPVKHLRARDVLERGHVRAVVRQSASFPVALILVGLRLGVDGHPLQQR